MRPEECLGKLLLRNGFKMAVAESCTGGLIGGAVTSVAGSSAYFRGGVIAYENDVKRDVLGVSQKDLDTYGAVSAQVVESMASGAARLFGCDCAVSVSGVAGPGGGSEEKPVGLVYIGVFLKGQVHNFRNEFEGSREEVRRQSVVSALEALSRTIENYSN